MKFALVLNPIRSTTPVRLGAILVLATGALFFSGCSSTLSVRSNLDAIVALAPAPVLVKQGTELSTADAAAANTTGAQAFLGAGESMEPIYASGTAIVVTPCDFATLRPGMSVVYVNHDGRGVAHSLVEKLGNGWVAQGVNNPDADADLVTARNLVGVITQAYASTDTPLRREIAGRAMLKMANATGSTQAEGGAECFQGPDHGFEHGAGPLARVTVRRRESVDGYGAQFGGRFSRKAATPSFASAEFRACR